MLSKHRLDNSRIVYLDAARGLVALLVIVLHSAAGYLKYPVPQWPRYGTQYHIAFDCLACLLQMFQMPVFYCLAGYFSFILFNKLNYLNFCKNRLKRIALPFFVIFTLINLPIFLARIVQHRVNSIQDVLLCFQNLSFLWFLEYLLIYYCLFLCISVIYKSIKIREKVNYILCVWSTSKWQWLPLILLHFVCLYFSGEWYNPIILNVMPNIWLLCIYGIYFFLGALLAKQGRMMSYFVFKRSPILIGFLTYLAYLGIMLYAPLLQSTRVLATAIYAIASYMLFVSFFSFCIKFFKKENRVLRLLADASYWIYLSQVFFIIFLHSFIVKISDSIFVQFGLTCFFTSILSLLSFKLILQPKSHYSSK